MVLTRMMKVNFALKSSFLKQITLFVDTKVFKPMTCANTNYEYIFSYCLKIFKTILVIIT